MRGYGGGLIGEGGEAGVRDVIDEGRGVRY